MSWAVWPEVDTVTGWPAASTQTSEHVASKPNPATRCGATPALRNASRTHAHTADQI